MSIINTHKDDDDKTVNMKKNTTDQTNWLNTNVSLLFSSLHLIIMFSILCLFP